MHFKAANAQSSNPVSATNAAVSSGKLVPTANPFSKKRQHSEISKPEAPKNGATAPVADEEDVSMHQQEEVKSAAVSDIKMVSAAESSNEAVSAVKPLGERSANERVPHARASNTEEAWRQLK